MPSFQTSDSWNFFKNGMHTRVEPITEESNKCMFDTIIKHFVASSTTPFATAVGHIGDLNTDGTPVTASEVYIPWELAFEAPDAIKSLIPDEKIDGVNWYDQVKEVAESGETILNVWAKTNPLDEDSWVHIANLDLLSDMVTSLFGDQRLYFQHQRFGYDRTYWPNMNWGR